jgi:hypothetical protein
MTFDLSGSRSHSGDLRMQRAAVKGGRRSAERTLDGRVGGLPEMITMEMAGLPGPGLCAFQMGSEGGCVPCYTAPAKYTRGL